MFADAARGLDRPRWDPIILGSPGGLWLASDLHCRTTAVGYGARSPGMVSKRLGSRYRSGRTKDWVKTKNPTAPAVRREAEEDWGKERWR